VQIELLAKIEDDDDDEPEDCLELWYNRRKELPNVPSHYGTPHVLAFSSGVARHGAIQYTICDTAYCLSYCLQSVTFEP